MLNQTLSGIYIHLPFCRSKCSYCSFYSVPNVSESVKNQYITRLIEEIKEMSIKLDVKGDPYAKQVKSLYLGGGTPSTLDINEIERLLKALKDHFNIDLSTLVESTIEINPGTVDKEYLLKLRSLGFDRLSMGIQTLNDDLLKTIGRIHTSEEALTTIKEAIEAGFENISVDIIFGLPGQTLEDIKNTLDKLTSFDEVKHLSAYSLIIEEDTPLEREIEKGRLTLPDEDLEREMQYFINSYLAEHGFKHYEISNYAKEGYEAFHNSLYWTLDDYLGLGAGASSFIKNKRINDYSSLEGYINNETKIESEEQDLEHLKGDFMFLGLRRLEGISDKEYRKRFDSSFFDDYSSEINKLLSNKLIEQKKDILFLSAKGLDLANQVFLEFV